MRKMTIGWVLATGIACLLPMPGCQQPEAVSTGQQSVVMPDSVVVLLGELVPDRIDEYERLHDTIPDVIVRNLKLSGIHDLRIYRKGTDLCLVYAQGDPSPDKESLYDREAEAQWQSETGACFASDPKWVRADEIFDLRTIASR